MKPTQSIIKEAFLIIVGILMAFYSLKSSINPEVETQSIINSVSYSVGIQEIIK
jgi:hypothetical protein